jgi:hypothetical protein
MIPEAQGRHCAACCKTVVDFTNMTDREMIAWLSSAGQNVCGRFAPHQLNQPLSLQTVQPKNRWTGWSLMLTGLLVSARLSAQSQSTTAKTPMERKNAPPVRITSEGTHTSFTGKAVLTADRDSLPKQPIDSFKTLAPVVVTAYANQSHRGSLGAYYVVRSVTISPWKDRVIDTLINCHLLPSKELTVYPNPVNRGAAISLSWQMEPGSYQLELFNAAGALIQTRVMQVESKTQVDLLEIPRTASAGVYVLRAARAGDEKVVTRKLIVR